MTRWIGIDEFVAVADEASFTKGAQRLNTSVAQISRRIKGLESQLGHQLLTRTTRTLALTAEGKVFLNHARHLQHAYNDATLALRQRDNQPTGTLRLTASVMYGERYIMPLVHDFMCLYPQINIEVVLTNEQLDLVSSGIDLAIRLGNLKSSTLKARKIALRNTLVCTSKEYLAQYGQPHTLEELTSHSCLTGNNNHWRFSHQGNESVVKVKGRLTCNSGWALLDAAKKGLGLVQLPHYYLQQAIADKQLVEVLSEFKPQEEGIWALYPARQYMPTSLRLLIDYLAQGMSGALNDY